MLFYLHTTSLNFNDIFSSESISPKIFYSYRQYGTNRHFLTENNFTEYGIVLCKNLTDVRLNKDLNLIQFPMILKINVNNEVDIHDLKKVNESTYIYNKTIYFSPRILEVLFYSEEDMKKVLNNSLNNLETKTLRKYIGKFKVLTELDKISPCQVPENWDKFNEVSNTFLKNEITNDAFFNTVKGFYCGILCKNTDILYYNDYDLEVNKVLSALNNILIKNRILNRKLSKIKKNTSDSRSYRNDIIRKGGLVKFKKSQREITLNNKCFSKYLDYKDLYVLNVIINQIININFNTRNKFSQEYFLELVSIVNRILKKSNVNYSMYINDLTSIYNKLTNPEIELKLDNISSNLMKNFYCVMIKQKDLEGLESIVLNKKIQNGFLAFGIAGAIIGFTGFPKTYTKELYENEDLIRDVDYQLNSIKDIMWKYNNSRYIGFKKLCILISDLKKSTNYYKFLRHLKELEKLLGCKIELNNTGDRLNITFYKNNGYKYVICLYLKKYKRIFRDFVRTINNTSLPYNITFGNFSHFKVYKVENKLKNELNLKDEEIMIEMIESILKFIKVQKEIR